jgi:hypothetical protein
MHSHAQLITVTYRINLGKVFAGLDEGIVIRRRSISIKAQHFPVVHLRILRIFAGA